MSDPAWSASERLAFEAGLIGGRLARLLRASFPTAGGALADSQAFLTASFEAVAGSAELDSFTQSVRSRGPRDAPHPLDRLIDALGLSEVEAQLVVLAGLAEEHEGFAAVLRSLHPRGEPSPSLGLAAQLLLPVQARNELRALVEHGAALRAGVVRLSGEAPLFERSLELPDRLWSVLHGISAWPAAVTLFPRKANLHGLNEWLARPAALRAITALAREEACTVLVSGQGDESLLWRGLALARRAGRNAAGIQLPGAPDADLARLIQVHALARGAVPVLLLPEGENPAAVPLDAFAEFPGALVLCARSGGVRLAGARPLVAVASEPLSAAARRQMWEQSLPSLAPHASFLAARYPIEPAHADQLAGDLAVVERLEGRPVQLDDFAAGMRARAGAALSGAVKLVKPGAGWDELVLPQKRLDQLREAVNRLLMQVKVLDEWGFLKGRVGGRGVRMLFSGPPGTGKTLSAEVMANALDVDLLVVDLSRVVSKWIGETEKNLASVFDGAERAQAVLLFDEADALFGKRTEVSDAHDRYANLETAYLLQRLERFEGLAILATNLKQNIDAAFTRRLEFSVEFDEPDREQRFKLWRTHIPPDAPLAEDVNLYELAALYPVVGGLIRNAAVAAAFLAAADGTPITRHQLVRAVRREYEKAGRAFPGLPVGLIL
jgi:hypothetical protein